jgi:hypothetical protein
MAHVLTEQDRKSVRVKRLEQALREERRVQDYRANISANHVQRLAVHIAKNSTKSSY